MDLHEIQAAEAARGRKGIQCFNFRAGAALGVEQGEGLDLDIALAADGGGDLHQRAAARIGLQRINEALGGQAGERFDEVATLSAQIHHYGVPADQRRDQIAEPFTARQKNGGKGLSSPAGLTLGSLLAY